MIQGRKHEKYWKSKNDAKRPLGALTKSYEQILSFLIRKFGSDIYIWISHGFYYFLLNSIYT